MFVECEHSNFFLLSSIVLNKCFLFTHIPFTHNLLFFSSTSSSTFSSRSTWPHLKIVTAVILFLSYSTWDLRHFPTFYCCIKFSATFSSLRSFWSRYVNINPNRPLARSSESMLALELLEDDRSGQADALSCIYIVLGILFIVMLYFLLLAIILFHRNNNLCVQNFRYQQESSVEGPPSTPHNLSLPTCCACKWLIPGSTGNWDYVYFCES